MTERETLLPCPFCGTDMLVDVLSGLRLRPGWIVDCAQCGARSIVTDTREQAIAAWNRRATPPAGPVVGTATMMPHWEDGDEYLPHILVHSDCVTGATEPFKVELRRLVPEGEN